jgi:hypothetical protein
VTDFRPAAHQTSYFEPFDDVVRRIVLPAPREKVVPHRDLNFFEGGNPKTGHPIFALGPFHRQKSFLTKFPGMAPG